MHIMEGYLDPVWCALWFILAIPFVVFGARAVIKLMREHPEQKMTVALSGAFIFLLSSLKMPSATGSSSHPTGTGLSSVLYGVSATAFLATIVLLFQAILLAHGGLTTLGANVFSMGIFGPLCGVLIWKIIRKAGASVGVSMFCAAVFADLCTYVMTAFQMSLNWGGLGNFLTTFAVTQIPIAIIEGILFYMFANYLINNKPEVFETAGGIIAPKETHDVIDEAGTSKKRSTTIYVVGMAIIAIMIVATLAYGYANGFEFGGADDAAGGIVEDGDEGFVPWFSGIFGDYELPGETESLLFALQAAIGALIIGFFVGRFTGGRNKGASTAVPDNKDGEKEPEKYYYRRDQPSCTQKAREGIGRKVKGRNGDSNEHIQMDTLAYSSRMLNWAPLGKLMLVIAVLIVNVLTSSVVVALAVLVFGLALMMYSTNMRIPFMLGLAIGEALLILVIACGIISINGNHADPSIWSGHLLWMDLYMTEASFNQAWLVLIRAVSGITVMMAFATSTPIPHLSQALRQIHMPAEVCEIIVLIYRYAFLLLERMDTMWSAAGSRMGFSGFMNSLKTAASIAVGIFTSSMNLSDKAQIALDCRGYRGYFPIYNRPPKAGIKWVAVTLVLFVGLLVLGMNTEGIVNFAGIVFGA
ncbi:MAG: energy-coupling factor ABC transporter permease [Candidatus Methanomethylophilaceae archaeon]|nr:energy-coupling factor ABC transporter permease [Candidatus Methanomethylophilaceae archaeon]